MTLFHITNAVNSMKARLETPCEYELKSPTTGTMAGLTWFYCVCGASGHVSETPFSDWETHRAEAFVARDRLDRIQAILLEE